MTIPDEICLDLSAEASAKPELRYQFDLSAVALAEQERLAYFTLDSDSQPGKLAFNRTITLKDVWAKLEAKQKESQ